MSKISATRCISVFTTVVIYETRKAPLESRGRLVSVRFSRLAAEAAETNSNDSVQKDVSLDEVDIQPLGRRKPKTMPSNMHISYDLRAPDKNYEKVIEKIKALGSWAHVHKSFWYVDTPLSASQVRDAVWSAMDENDSLYVVDATNNEAAWMNLDPRVSEHVRGRWHLKAA